MAQEGPLDNAQPKGTTPDEIIKRFAAKETEFAKAREQYTYPSGRKGANGRRRHRGWRIQGGLRCAFNDKGQRMENVVFAPQSSLSRIFMSQEDLEDIRHRLPFVLTDAEVPEYNILYVGQQQEDELHCYVFDIAPKKIEGRKRYFQGRVWVDDHDFQIVKTYGKTVPDLCNGHPRTARSTGIRKTSFQSSPHGASRSMDNTGFPCTPRLTTCTSRWRRAHQGNREVRGLQAVRLEREDSVRRERSSEGTGPEGARPTEAG